VQRTANWFLNSRIYDDGAYVSYYSKNDRGPRYPEITAYAISLSCLLYRLLKEKVFLERAVKCAHYMDQVINDGAVPGIPDGLFYVFDTGIYVSGLFDLYDATKEEAYLKQAQQSIEWMYSKWDGEKFSAVDHVPYQKKWYHLPSVHLAKMSIPLLRAASYLKDVEHEKIAHKLLEKYKRLQLDRGNFQINDDARITLTHPHCYATEAFLFAYYHSQRNEYLEVAERASSWLSLSQNKDGSLYREYYIGDDEKERVRQAKTNDAISQATRIWKLLGVNQDGIERAYGYLNRETLDNGLPLFKYPSLTGKLFSWRREVFSWPTFFYLHSLTLPFGQMEYCRDLF
jgi:uncharacterized protein YyaL (SSP411 family)